MSTTSAVAQIAQPQRADVRSRSRRTSSPTATIGALPPIHRLQRAMGNRRMERWFRGGAIQAKLAVNLPGDEYEREADRVADQVMRMSEPKCTCAASGEECTSC